MSKTQSEFDAFAVRYEEALSQGLGVTGEVSAYFAKGRIEVLASLLNRLGSPPIQRVLDFGCGTGGSRPWLHGHWPDAEYVGYDPSRASLEVAEKRHAQPRTTWSTNSANLNQFDLILTNGVFHHIPPTDRPAAFAVIKAAMKPSGIFAFFENNPWNPGTCYIMSRVKFDRTAITISPKEARRLLRDSGFFIKHFASLFYFPSVLAFLRPFECWFRFLPLGGQYLYICQLK
jgi:SAM-dependent methyltransferase